MMPLSDVEALLLGKLLMLPFSGRRWTRLPRLFWPVFFPFLYCLDQLQTSHLPLPSVCSDLFPSLYYLELCQFPDLPFCISILLNPTVLSLDLAKPYGETLSSQWKTLKNQNLNFGGTFGQRLFWNFDAVFKKKKPAFSVYDDAKSQKWPKAQIKGLVLR